MPSSLTQVTFSLILALRYYSILLYCHKFLHMNNILIFCSDDWKRKYTEVVAMDAAVIKDKSGQYSNYMVTRELNKVGLNNSLHILSLNKLLFIRPFCLILAHIINALF